MNLLTKPGVTVEPRFSHALVEPAGGLATLRKPCPQDVGYQYRSTWQGPDTPCGQDWYICRFPERIRVNTVGFAHGPLYMDGGWWRAFDVEWLDGDEHWRSVSRRRVTPPYDFSNTFWDQAAYQPYAVAFDPVETRAIRLVGEAGGSDSYVSLAWLGVFFEEEPLEQPAWLVRLPPPRLFQLLEPARLWDFLRDFQVITNLGVFAVPKAYEGRDWPGVEQYLDGTRRREYAQAVEQYSAADGFLSMVTARTAGDVVFADARQAALLTSQTNTPHLVVHSGNLAHLFAPVVVSGEALGTLQTWSAVFCEQADLAWHRQWAAELDRRGIVSKEDYLRALATVPVMSRRQLEACLRMLGLISGEIANLAEQNMRQARQIEEMRQSIDQLKSWRQQMAQQAIAYMRAHLDEPIRLRDIARHVMLSSSYFSQIFREETGQSPIDYLIDHRMEHAKRLLRAGSANVTEAAGAVGYDSVSYFIRQFAARVGVTPGQWMRQE